LHFIMRALASFFLLLFCVVTLTTPTALGARMLPVSAASEAAAHCQTSVDHSDSHQADLTKSADPGKPASGDCADCSSCLICACHCQPLLASSNLPQAVSQADSTPEPALAGRVGITAAPELKPPRK